MIRRQPSWAATDITDIGNGDPNKIDPGEVKQASGWAVEKPLLQHMNWIMNLFGKWLTGLTEVKQVITEVQLEVGMRVVVDNSVTVCNVYLPEQPLEGQWVEVGARGRYSAYAVVLHSVEDIATPTLKELTLDQDFYVYRFVWDTTLNRWLLGGIKIQGIT